MIVYAHWQWKQDILLFTKLLYTTLQIQFIAYYNVQILFSLHLQTC